MSILILNRINMHSIPYHDLLGNYGEDIYLLTDAQAVTEEDLSLYRKRYKHFEALSDYDCSGMVELRAVELHKSAQFRRIVAVSEFDLLRAARLRNFLQIEGQTFTSALAFRDKVYMKEIAKRAGIKVPPFRRLENVVDLLEFVQENCLPVVIKPIFGAGSENTYIIRSNDELNEVLQRGLYVAEAVSNSFEVEKFIEGPMYHINGFVYEGQVVANWPARYVNDCRSFLDGEIQGSYILSRSDHMVGRLRGFVEELLQVLPTPATTAFHVEVFNTPDDEIVLCEVASRVAGPMVPEQFQVSFNFDLREAFVKGMGGYPITIPPRATFENPKQMGGELLIPFRNGILKRAPFTCDLAGVLAYDLHAEIGRHYRETRSINDFVATFVLTANSDAEMVDRIDAASAWFERESLWTTEKETAR